MWLKISNGVTTWVLKVITPRQLVPNFSLKKKIPHSPISPPHRKSTDLIHEPFGGNGQYPFKIYNYCVCLTVDFLDFHLFKERQEKKKIEAVILYCLTYPSRFQSFESFEPELFVSDIHYKQGHIPLCWPKLVLRYLSLKWWWKGSKKSRWGEWRRLGIKKVSMPMLLNSSSK